MPLEIKYKECERPIKEIIFTRGRQYLCIEIEGSVIWARIGNSNANDGYCVSFTPADFKEWAAAIYKFSQEV